MTAITQQPKTEAEKLALKTGQTIATKISTGENFVYSKKKGKSNYKKIENDKPVEQPQQPTYNEKKYINSPNQKVQDALKYGTSGDLIRASREATSQGYSYEINRPEFERNTYTDKKGNIYNIKNTRDRDNRNEYLRQFEGTTFTDSQGKGFSQNPDTVVTKNESKPYQPSINTYASGREEKDDSTTTIYGMTFKKNVEDDSIKQFFQDYDTYDKNANTKSNISKSPYNPLMYVKRGANTFKVATGLGLATTLQYGKVISGQETYSEEQLKTISNFGRNVVEVQTSVTGGYVGGYVLGGTVASYPGVKSVISSKPFVYSSAVMTGAGFGYGYSKAENKGLFTAKFVGGFVGGIGGYKRGFAEYDPLNPDLKLSNPKLSYSERETISRLKTNRLIETNNDFVVSKRIGSIDVTKEVKPLEFKFTQKISGRAKGQRSTFVSSEGEVGIIDRYSYPRIFGGKQQIVREYTPIIANNPKMLAFDYEAYAFGKKNKIINLAEGVVEYPKPSFYVGKGEASPKLRLKQKVNQHSTSHFKKR